MMSNNMRRPRIICQMRIKNEGRWLKEVLDDIARIAQGIVILDDGSDDDTPEICKGHSSVVDYVWQSEPTINEVRDKNRLLKMALRHHPEWVLCVDGDELFEVSGPERILDAIRTCPPDVSVMDFEFLYMWDDRRHYRTDGIYNRIFHHRLFGLKGQDVESLAFSPTRHGGNFHCESVPSNLKGRSREIDVKIKHLGYMLREDRIRKHEWYTEHDSIHAAQGYYDHLLDQPGMIIKNWVERPFAPAAGGVSPENGTSSASSTEKQEIKPEYYYANARQNIASLVPQGCKRVLDVGCGHGLTGGLLRSERNIEVVGIELHPEVAETARKHLDQVVEGDIERMELPFAAASFDCLILADVLEHLVDPWSTLRKLVGYLAPHGTVIASVPNIRNLGIIRRLLDGSWHYEEQGILDRTHLRFFALKDMKALFEQAGINAVVREIVPDPLFKAFSGSIPVNGSDLTVGNLVLKGVSPEDFRELTAQQFIFVGRKTQSVTVATASAVEPKRPLVSVIIPVYNNVDYTKQCVASLFEVGERVDFEVVVVDDASSDGTREFLADSPFGIRSVTNPRNLGFAGSCNAGARVARGDYLVFLNNDTIVTSGWLSEMIACLKSNPAIGIVGNLQIYPDSGKVQHAGIVCGENRTLFSIYNNQLSHEHPAVVKPREFQFVAGSCMLMEKGLFFRLGGFDESYLNSCEDVDLCMKARDAGRKVYYCPQSRIYHFESKTVAGHPKDERNYRLFIERWGGKIVRDDLNYLASDGFRQEVAVEPERVRSPSGKVVLIAPPRYFPSAKLCDYTGFSKNLGIAYIASMLRDHGVGVSVLDAFALGASNFIPVDLPNGRVYRCGLSYETIANAIPREAEIVGISVPFTNVSRIAAELGAYLKRCLPSVKIVLGGVHPSVFPMESMTEGVDFVVSGEGEFPMLALALGETPSSIPDLYCRDASGRILRPSRSATLKNLDNIGLPAWDLLPMDRYLQISPRGNRSHRSLSVITSRGCPFACNFCSIHPVSGRSWRARSPENVLGEIRQAHEQYGIEHIEIEDDNFTLDKERAIRILAGLKDISPTLTWAAHNGVRIDTLDEELLAAVKQSGCVQLNLAVEHGSPHVLKAMNKKLSVDKVRQVAEICGRLGIRTLGFCLVGYPGETDECFKESFLFYRELRKLGLQAIAPFIVNAYPGTQLYNQARQNGWLNPHTDNQLFFLEDEFVSITTPDFDEATVRLRKRAMELLNPYPEMNLDHLSQLLGEAGRFKPADGKRPCGGGMGLAKRDNCGGPCAGARG
ncbi:MAG: glycosyltransferase [Syntrophobacteraceae bacterium]